MLIIATHHFKEPYPIVNEIDLLYHATMDLLIQFAYPSLSGYGKFTISYTMFRSYGEEISFTVGAAIPLTYQDCKKIPMNDVYVHIYRYIQKYAEIYDKEFIVRLMIRVYMDGKKMDRPVLSSEERYSILSSIAQSGFPPRFLSKGEALASRSLTLDGLPFCSFVVAERIRSHSQSKFLV